ncbi:hypothetical protein RHGRI_018122 [Rhododendron griersonianum]|uniref:Uncharacterized protein n=1 Tax=Rhododendron griersonianum TaxID=479676 RepID=A0AAV6K099_9ERIC|nr:hypothetical protein RHGRI_018122 [Rhododendron griersonianum]
MKQRIVIKVVFKKGQKSRSKAMRIVGGLAGIGSVAFAGPDKNHIVVTGDGIDAVELTKLLRKKVGSSELVSVGPVEYGSDGYGKLHGGDGYGYGKGHGGDGYGKGHGGDGYGKGHGGDGYGKVHGGDGYGYGKGHGGDGYGKVHGGDGYGTMQGPVGGYNSYPYAYGSGQGYGFEIRNQNPYSYGPGYWYETGNQNPNSCSIL